MQQIWSKFRKGAPIPRVGGLARAFPLDDKNVLKLGLLEHTARDAHWVVRVARRIKLVVEHKGGEGVVRWVELTCCVSGSWCQC